MTSRKDELSGVSVYSNQTYLASSGRIVDRDQVFTSNNMEVSSSHQSGPIVMSDWERRRYQQMKQRKRSSSLQRPTSQTENLNPNMSKVGVLQSIDPNSPKKQSNAISKRIGASKVSIRNDQIEVTPMKPPRGMSALKSLDINSPIKISSTLKSPKRVTKIMVNENDQVEVTPLKLVEKSFAIEHVQRNITHSNGIVESKTTHNEGKGNDEKYQEFFEYLKNEVSYPDVSYEKFSCLS